MTPEQVTALTDIAATFLFSEALQNLNTANVRVVGFAQAEEDKALLRHSYRTLFPVLTDEQFDFRGALNWAKGIARTGA